MKNSLTLLIATMLFATSSYGKRLNIEPTLGAQSLFADYEYEAIDNSFAPNIHMVTAGVSINDRFSLEVATSVDATTEKSDPEPYGLVNTRYVMELENLTTLKAAAIIPNKIKYFDGYAAITYSWLDIEMARDFQVAEIKRNERGQAPGVALGARFHARNIKAYMEYGDYFRDSEDGYKTSLTGFLVGVSIDLNI